MCVFVCVWRGAICNPWLAKTYRIYILKSQELGQGNEQIKKYKFLSLKAVKVNKHVHVNTKPNTV